MGMADTVETRYDRLLLLLDKALSHSRKAINVEEAIKECYGDDAKMFDVASSDENFLVSAINAMIDVVNEKAKKETLQYLRREKIEQVLVKVETIIDKLDSSDEEVKQADAEDRRAALAALEAARLPKGVSPSDVIRFQACNLMKEHLLLLQNKLAEEEAATDVICGRKRELESTAIEGGQNLKRVKQRLQHSAERMQDSGGDA